MVFAEPPTGATNVTVAVVAPVAVATTDVGAAIYVCIELDASELGVVYDP